MVAQGAGVIIHITSIQRQLPLPEATPRLRGRQGARSTYSKGLSKESQPQGRARGTRLARLGRDRRRGRLRRGNRAPQRRPTRRRRKIVMASLGGIPLGRPAKPREVGRPSCLPRLAGRAIAGFIPRATKAA
jgi:hypothetical protein